MNRVAARGRECQVQRVSDVLDLHHGARRPGDGAQFLGPKARLRVPRFWRKEAPLRGMIAKPLEQSGSSWGQSPVPAAEARELPERLASVRRLGNMA